MFHSQMQVVDYFEQKDLIRMRPRRLILSQQIGKDSKALDPVKLLQNYREEVFTGCGVCHNCGKTYGCKKLNRSYPKKRGGGKDQKAA